MNWPKKLYEEMEYWILVGTTTERPISSVAECALAALDKILPFTKNTGKVLYICNLCDYSQTHYNEKCQSIKEDGFYCHGDLYRETQEIEETVKKLNDQLEDIHIDEEMVKRAMTKGTRFGKIASKYLKNYEDIHGDINIYSRALLVSEIVGAMCEVTDEG